MDASWMRPWSRPQPPQSGRWGALRRTYNSSSDVQLPEAPESRIGWGQGVRCMKCRGSLWFGLALGWSDELGHSRWSVAVPLSG